jgi:hypothetical protein
VTSCPDDSLGDLIVLERGLSATFWMNTSRTRHPDCVKNHGYSEIGSDKAVGLGKAVMFEPKPIFWTLDRAGVNQLR